MSNESVTVFPYWASIAVVKAVSGDFDGDGDDDIALTGGSGWLSVPVAFFNGDDTFTVSNQSVTDFPFFASQANVKAVSGDFDGDGDDDIALTGNSTWGSVPVAFSNGDGTFTVSNQSITDFPFFASQANVKAVSGDFDGYGDDDIALTGNSTWGSVPVAFSNGDGTFTVSNQNVTDFPIFSRPSN